MVEPLEWIEGLPSKCDEYVTAQEFTTDLPLMTPSAEMQFVMKLNVAGIKLSKTAWNLLPLSLQMEVAESFGRYLGDREWLIRSEGGLCVAVLGPEYTIINNDIVAKAVAKCGLPCYDIWPWRPDAFTKTVYFKLVSRDHKYTLENLGFGPTPFWLAINLRNSEIGHSAIAADIGLCRGDVITGNLSYMWSKQKVEVSACIRHYYNDPDKVMGVIEEILTEAPGIVQMHIDYIKAAKSRKWHGWDEGDDQFPQYVMEHVDSVNPKSVADVYFAICDSLREVENAMLRRRMEFQALAIMDRGRGMVVPGITTVVGRDICPMCGREQDDG